MDADAGRERAETAAQLEGPQEDEAGACRERADTPTQWEERSGHTENAGRERVDTAVQLEEPREDRTDTGQQRVNGEDTQAGQGRADAMGERIQQRWMLAQTQRVVLKWVAKTE